MKRLLCLVSIMDAGGAETFLMKIYRELDKLKYQMDFCVNIPRKGFYDDEIESLGGEIHYIPPKSENLQEFRKQLYNLVKSKNYRYVLRITSNATGFMDLKIAKKAGAQVCIARSSNSSDGKSIKNKMVHLIGRMIYGKYVDVKIAPSDLAAIYTFGNRAYKRCEVNILHNAVDLNIYKFNAFERQNTRRALGVADESILIGHIGRFSQQKNHELLINIVNEIHKQDKSSMLLMVGVGDLKNKIQKKVQEFALEDYVLFQDVRKDIPFVLSAIDVMVFPSYYEGMPNIIIEAQATGLPCLLSDTITKQADISGKLLYLDINAPISYWGIEALKLAKQGRYDSYETFRKNGYDIRTTCKDFVTYIFGNE